MNDREAWITDTLVELADTLVSDFDLPDVLAMLVDRCVELLDAAEVGIVLVDQHGSLHAMTSSTERMHALELLELQNDEGPCLDCIRGNAVVGATALDEEANSRWPSFVPAATSAGFQVVLAFPMRVRDRVVGAVNVFFAHERSIPASDLRVAQALADTATIGILQERALRSSAEVVTQLQAALSTRVVIEQVKGMLAESHQIHVDDAFQVLRAYARDHNLKLGNVARAIAHRELPLDAITTQGE